MQVTGVVQSMELLSQLLVYLTVLLQPMLLRKVAALQPGPWLV